MRSAVILAILGAAAALPAPQAPPPAAVPTATIPDDTTMEAPMGSGFTMPGAKPTGASSISDPEDEPMTSDITTGAASPTSMGGPEDDPMDSTPTTMVGGKPTGAFTKGGPEDDPMGPSGISMGGAHPTGGFGPKPPKGEKTWEGKGEKTFDNGQWSQWASKTGGWHPEGKRPGPTGGGGWWGNKGHHSGHASKTGGMEHTKTGAWEPTKTPINHGVGPTGGPKTPIGARPTMMPDNDDEQMSILPADPEPTTMERRALDINYHLAPRHNNHHGPPAPKNGDDDDSDDSDDEDSEKHGEEGKKHSSLGENPPFGKATPTFGGGFAHPTGKAGNPDAEPTISLPGHREGRPTGTGSFVKPTDDAFGGRPDANPSETVPEPSDVAGGIPPKASGTGRPQTRPSNPEEAPADGQDDNTLPVEPTPTMKL